jgi:hypothetical protein
VLIGSYWFSEPRGFPIGLVNHYRFTAGLMVIELRLDGIRKQLVTWGAHIVGYSSN